MVLEASTEHQPVLLSSRTRVAPLSIAKQSIPSGVGAVSLESMWNHCPGLESPADIGSRGDVASKLKSNQLGWRGPSWLSEPKTNWPKSEERPESITEVRRTGLKRVQPI